MLLRLLLYADYQCRYTAVLCLLTSHSDSLAFANMLWCFGYVPGMYCKYGMCLICNCNVYVYMCIYTYTYTYTHIHTHACAGMILHTCMHACMHAYMQGTEA